MSPIGRIFRALILLVALLVPVLLIWFFGWWGVGVLLVMSALVALTVLFSTGKARGREETQSGDRTGYRTTSFADF
ncbi:hypothetical protein QTI66_02880 [Variovorax sp. J22R133]|uniref:hypothetical protein n=1 Tax=Variovorax brevis TaxID=3053503 RepID=UPI002577CA34|nr:hypothetical protein [Variovorax sp. J22R133]MDM0111073.1 hypothetical protein [Variovorax sp. J22R133]